MANLEKLMLDKTVIKMKRFKINEFQQIFKFLHLDLEWKDVVKQVSKCRLRLNIVNVVSVIHQYLKDSNLIEETYLRVMLADAIYHQNSQWWTVTMNTINKRLLEKEIIRNNIQAMLNKLNINAVTYVMHYDKMFWVLINMNESKKNNINPKLKTPYFFTITTGKVFHVFHRPQNVDNRLLKIVIKSVGAKKCKSYDLSGKHLQSMVNLLEDRNKENKQENLQKLPDNYKVENVQEYVQQLFGNKQQVLNNFTINVESDYSMLSNTNPYVKTCKTKVELKGNSIISGVKDMMLSGVLQPPYSDWVMKLPVLGKNSVHVDIRS